MRKINFKELVYILIKCLLLSIAMVIIPSLIKTQQFPSRFVIALILSMIVSTTVSLLVPLDRVAIRFCQFLKLEQKSLLSFLVGNISANLVMSTVISLVMTLVFVGLKHFFAAFWADFLLMYVISYLASVIAHPFALKTSECLSANRRNK